LEVFVSFFDELEKKGIKITPEQKKTIEERFTQALQYEPVIGIFGKTGVGKSSLCNALFGAKICEISDIKACTRDTQKVLLELGGKGLTLLDVPGVSENPARDQEYNELYAKLLPDLDLVLWVLKADDRAFSSDEKCYEDIIKPHIQQGKPFYFVLNQVDKIEPYREWDDKKHKPGVTQFSNIDAKIAYVAEVFSHPKTQIVPVSANEKYNLVNLMDTIVYALPGAKRSTMYIKVPKENRSEKQETYAREGLADEIRKIIREELGSREADKSEDAIQETSRGLFGWIGDRLDDVGRWLRDHSPFGPLF
jgi:small GTP-binding protein